MSRIALPFAFALTLSLAACNSAPPSASEPTAEAPVSSAPAATPVADASKRCDAASAQSAVGKTASQEVVDQAVADSGSSTARVIKPGQPVTMDYREDRLNIEVDAGNVVTAVRCG